MKLKRPNKSGNQPTNQGYLHSSPKISGDANSGTRVGFGGNVGGVNPAGGVNDIYLPKNQPISGGANDNIYLQDNQEV